MAIEFANRLALINFMSALFYGLCNVAEFSSTLRFALLSSVCLYGAGLVIGEIMQRLIEEFVEAEIAQQLSETVQNS